MRESKLTPKEQKYPGYERGLIPLGDVKRRFGLTTDELRELDVPKTTTVGDQPT